MSQQGDREEIRQLLATYTIQGDRGRIDALASVFAEDATLLTPGWRAEGRAGIVQALRGVTDAAPRPGENAAGVRGRIVRHHLTSSLIELEGENEARGRTYWINYSEKGADHSGVYVDRYRRIDGHWRIVHREVRIDWKAPDSWTDPALPAGPRPPDAPPRAVFTGR